VARESRTLEGLVTAAHAWNGRRVLITGHTGFKGAWLTLWLREKGAEVHGYALEPPTDPSLFKDAKIGTALAGDTRADIRDLEAFEQTLRRVQPEVVFHLAAQSLVRPSYAAPVETFDVNVMGTVNVLQAALRAGSVRAAVIVTSDKCYENLGGGQAYRESDPMGGSDPYSASKGCAELVVAAFRASAKALGTQGDAPTIASVRSGNVVGGGDWSADRLLPDCVRSFIAGETVKLRYPQAVRPWLHVLEPLAGYILLAEKMLATDGERFATAFNFGPGTDNDATVLIVAETAARLWGNAARVEVIGGLHLPEAGMLRLDAAKAAALLGWSPRWDLTQTLDRTVEWYRSWKSGADVRALMVRQFADFAAAAP
jgi:CDP-glucose 4,6-dehydratase